MFEPETWVAIAFIILMGVFAWLGVHRTVLTALDHRADRIRGELDDARRLKEEAAKVLAEYKAKRATAEREAAEIVANAKAEAERIAAEARTKMEDFGRCPCRSGRRRGTGRLDHPVAIGEGLARRRPARQGHCRSPAETELNQKIFRQLKEAAAGNCGGFFCFVGWAKRSVPTNLHSLNHSVGTALTRLCPPYDLLGYWIARLRGR